MSGHKLVVINFFAGPGAGKSTSACETFAALKKRDIKCEYVSEVAKDLTYEQSFHTRSNGLYVLAKQYHRMWRLLGHVDVIVTDSPLLLNMAYNDRFHDVCRELFDEFDNRNYFIKRSKKYMQYGRTQTPEEAQDIDLVVKNLLEGHEYQELDYNMAGIQATTDYLLSVDKKV